MDIDYKEITHIDGFKAIDGSKVLHEFPVLWDAWECDNLGWITEDKRVWGTTHGSPPYEVGIEFIKERIKETECVVAGLKHALSIAESDICLRRI